MKNANNSSSMSEVRSDAFLNRETRRGKSTNFLLRRKSILLLEESEPIPATYVFPFCLFNMHVKQEPMYVSYMNLLSNVSSRA